MTSPRLAKETTTPPLAPTRMVAGEALAWRAPVVDADASVADARDLMCQTGQRVVLVTSGHAPVGVITKGELWGAGGVGPRADARVQDVMHLELVRIAPDTDVNRTLRRYADAGWSSLYRRRPGRRSDVGHRCAS